MIGLVAFGLLAEMDWVLLIVSCGVIAALIAVGIYVTLMVRDWATQRAEFESVGDDLESLRRALELGSIDEEEYHRGVAALRQLNEKLSTKSAEPIDGNSFLLAGGIDQLPGSTKSRMAPNELSRGESPPGRVPTFHEVVPGPTEQETEAQMQIGGQVTEREIRSPSDSSDSDNVQG